MSIQFLIGAGVFITILITVRFFYWTEANREAKIITLAGDTIGGLLMVALIYVEDYSKSLLMAMLIISLPFIVYRYHHMYKTDGIKPLIVHALIFIGFFGFLYYYFFW